MGTITVTGALIITIGWVTLIEFDSFPESERQRIMQEIKKSPSSILLIALMPIGIFINMLGIFSGILWVVILGASLIFIQGIIASFLFWNHKRWKSVFLFVVMLILGIFIYIPLFLS